MLYLTLSRLKSSEPRITDRNFGSVASFMGAFKSKLAFARVRVKTNWLNLAPFFPALPSSFRRLFSESGSGGGSSGSGALPFLGGGGSAGSSPKQTLSSSLSKIGLSAPLSIPAAASGSAV